MKKVPHAFPLKPLVIALAAAQGLSLAHADLVEPTTATIDSTLTTSYVVETDNLTITQNGAVNGNGSSFAVSNTGHLTTLIDNQGIIVNQRNFAVQNTTGMGFYNSQQITTLKNSGSIFSINAIAMENDGQIGSLINSGIIHADRLQSDAQNVIGIINYGPLSTLTNTQTGMISGSDTAMSNFATITTLNNDGFIGQINPGLINTSNNAIVNSGTIGAINNSGSIVGNIVNNSANPLLINGGTDRRGLLTGVGYGPTGMTTDPVGQLISTGADVRFGQGKLLLNDNVDLGGSHTLTNNADIMVNQALNINGNYHQTNAAILRIGVGDALLLGRSISDANYGRLVISGNALLDSGSAVNLAATGSSYGFASGQRYIVISAATADYNIDTLHYSVTGYDGKVIAKVIDNDVTKDLAFYLEDKTSGASPSNPGKSPFLPTTSNAISSLNGLSGYSGFSGGLLNLFNASKTLSSEAEANRAGEQLSPAQNSMASAATSAASMDALGVVGGHLDGLRVAQNGGSRGIATGDDSLEWAAWGKPFYGSARQGMIDNVSGYRAHYGGLVLGADRQVQDNWRAGAALSYSRTSVKGQDNVKGSNSDVDAWGGIIYASYSGEPWFVNLSTSLTRQSYDSQRIVSFSGFNDSASSHFNGQQVALKSEVGYPLALGANTTLTPLASLSYSYLHQGSYQENSDNGSALSVDSAHSQSVESSLGSKLSHNWSTAAGEMTPFVQLMWTHQYDRSAMTTTSGFTADSLGETRFTSQGARLASDSAEASVGINLAHSDDLNLEARYDLQAAPHFEGQTVSLQARKLF